MPLISLLYQEPLKAKLEFSEEEERQLDEQLEELRNSIALEKGKVRRASTIVVQGYQQRTPVMAHRHS